MNELLSGAVAMASLVIALFFLRFWRDSRDRFFLYFALSFLAQAGDRVVATLRTQLLAGDFDFDAAWNLNGNLANPRHRELTSSFHASQSVRPRSYWTRRNHQT